MNEELNATNLEKSKGQDEFEQVEDLIKQTLKETIVAEKKAEPTPPAPAPKPMEKILPAPIKTADKPQPIVQTIEKKPLSEAEKYDATFKEYQVGDIVKGTIVKVDPSGVIVDIKYKADGIILSEELSDKAFTSPDEIVKVGQVISVYIENLENKEGNVVLSKKRADQELVWKTAYSALKNKTLLEGKVLQVLRGGLVVDCDGLRGFVPASQVAKGPEETLESFKDKVLPLHVIEVNHRQGKITLSHKLAAGSKGKQQSSKVFDELEVGQVKHGKVCSIKSFGAFVDLGGVEGLIHLSELSWKRVKHPSEAVKMGQELDVFVLGVDKVNKKVALGLKELQEDPWEKAAIYYKPGQLIKVKIARFAKFGAFAELEHDLEGLIHVSEMSKDPVYDPNEAKYPDGQPIKIGDVVEVKILRVIPDEQKIGLSIKAAIYQKEKEEAKKNLPDQEPAKVTIGDLIAQKEKEKAEREEMEVDAITEEEAEAA